MAKHKSVLIDKADLELLDGMTLSGTSALCPVHVHGDTNPSLWVSRRNGEFSVRCMAGCSPEDVRKSIDDKRMLDTNGKQSPDANAHSAAANGEPTPSGKSYTTLGKLKRAMTSAGPLRGADITDYKYPDTFYVLRFDLPNGSKSYRPCHRSDDGRWYAQGPQGKLPLYHRDKITDSKVIYIVEGEKAADAGAAIGLTCVTSAFGSASPHKTDWTPLKGKKTVILPDNDDGGYKYAEVVAIILHDLDCPLNDRNAANHVRRYLTQTAACTRRAISPTLQVQAWQCIIVREVVMCQT